MKTLKYVLSFTLLFFSLAGSGVAWAASQAAPLYLSFEQRLMTSYALLAQGEARDAKEVIFQRMIEQGQRNAAIGEKEIIVENFEEFLKEYRGQWPDTNSLKRDLEIIEAREARGIPKFISSSASVQRKIDKFIVDQNKRLVDIAMERWNSADPVMKGLSHKLLSSFSLQIADQNESFVKKMTSAAAQFSEQIIATQIEELENLGEKVSQSKLVNQKDPVAKIVLETLLNEYFSGLSLDSKKLLLSSFLGSDLMANDLAKFEIMVQNSGPQLQKLLQVVARQGDLDPEMAAIFKKLESSVRPVPWSQVEELLNKERSNFEFTYFEQKPLGVGSMAQVHRAKILIDGKRQDVVVRFIKPDIANRVMEDDRILKKIASILDANPELRRLNFPKIATMVEEITRTVTAELDQAATIERQKLGKAAYERKVNIRTESGYAAVLKIQVPEIFAAKNKSAFMVQKLVFGSKLDKEFLQFKDEIPELKQIIVEKLARVWLGEALFGSGFYHADLHQGNFMLRVAEPNPVLTILDYGMSGVLSNEMQEIVIALGAAFRGLDAQAIAKGFWKISNEAQNQIKYADFEKEVRLRVKDIQKKKVDVPTTDAWILWAIDKGLHPNYDFISLNRGNVIIASMLAEVGSKETVDTITEKLVMQHPNSVAKALLSHRDWKIQNLIKAAVNPAKPSKAAPIYRCESVFLN